jgi:hypothetical protein
MQHCQQCFHSVFVHLSPRRKKIYLPEQRETQREKDLTINLSPSVIVVLFDDTFLTFLERLNSLISPRGNFVTVHVILPTIIIKAVCNLMSHDSANA